MTSWPIIDAHQHFWDLAAHHHPWLAGERIPFRYGDYGPICRSYLPSDYRTDVAGYAVIGTVHMEAEIAAAEAVEESRWLTGLAAQEGLPWACVAQARLDQPDVGAWLAAQAAWPIVRGIRHKPATAASAAEVQRGAKGGMDDPVWRAGYAQLQRYRFSFDLQAPWWHAAETSELAADFPATTLIINHTFLPANRSAEGLAGWRAALEQVARHENVALKISGLGLRGQPWRAAENVPLISDAIGIMGWQRCLFASNFPVDSLVAGFRTIADAFLEAIAHRPAQQIDALLHGNARRVYRLDAAIGASEPHSTGREPCPSAAAASP